MSKNCKAGWKIPQQRAEISSYWIVVFFYQRFITPLFCLQFENKALANKQKCKQQNFSEESEMKSSLMDYWAAHWKVWWRNPKMNFSGSSPPLHLSLISIFTLAILSHGSMISNKANKKYFIINSSQSWKEAKSVSILFRPFNCKIRFWIWLFKRKILILKK